MDSQLTLLPILHESDWSGAALAETRPLVADASPWVPLIALVEDSASRRLTLTRAKLDEDGERWEPLFERACASLAKRGIGLRPRADGAVVAIDEYASSMLVAPTELERMRAAVAADEVLLAAPTRGILVATARSDGADEALAEFARESFASSLDARITPLVFAWDGRALSALAPPTERGASLVELAYDEDEETLSLALSGPLTPAIERALVALLLSGRTADGRSVLHVRLTCDAASAARAAAVFAEEDLTPVVAEASS